MPLNMNQQMRLEELIEAAKDQPSLLNEWEKNFIQSQIENLEKYGQRMQLSEKQWVILDKIAVKLAL